MTMEFSTDGGDEGTFAATFGPLQPLASSDAPATAADCGGSDRSLVVRVDTTLTLTSSLPAQVGVSFDVYSGGQQAVLLIDSSYGGPVCGNRGVDFGEVPPETPTTFTYWVLYVAPISPNAPTGDPVQIGQILFHLSSIYVGINTVAEVTAAYGPRVIGCGTSLGEEIWIVYGGKVPTKTTSQQPCKVKKAP